MFPAGSSARSLSVAFSFVLAISLARGAGGQVADAGPDREVLAVADCQSLVLLDASGSTIPEGEAVSYLWMGNFPEGDGMVSGEQAEVTLPVGVSEVTLQITNSQGEVSSDTVLIAVKDPTPPVMKSIAASPSMIWPPNHRMVAVEIQIEVEDDCDAAPECEITSIRSNQSEDGKGDGHTAPDWQITGALTAMVRAERSGSGGDRVYTIVVSCTDGSENRGEHEVTVRVPHDMGKDDPDHDEDHTTCSLKVDFRRPEKNRLQAHLDVSEGAVELPENDTSTRSDDLEGYRLLLEIGDEDFGGMFDGNGLILTDALRARFSSDGESLDIEVKGLDLESLLDLDPGERIREVSVLIPIRAEAIPPEGSELASVVLFDGTLECSYKQVPFKKGKGKGPRHHGRR